MTTTSYIVVPFKVGARGKLTPGEPQHAKDQFRAVRAADRIAPRSAGVVVLEQQADAKTDFFAEPRLVYRTGEIPAELVEQLGS